MKKQLEAELKELAISVLNNTSEVDINTLKEQAASIYERLCVLAYTENKPSSKIIEKPVNTTISTESIPTNETPKQEIISEKPRSIEQQIEPQKEISIETLEKPEETNAITEKKPIETIVPKEKTPDLLFELEELTADFENMPEFERAIPEAPEKQATNFNETVATSNTSLNESLKKGITIGLNDRLAFIKHLFNNNQQDYTRVISQLNTIENSTETSSFIEQMVKPEYNNWEGKEDFEQRFINAVFSKFDD